MKNIYANKSNPLTERFLILALLILVAGTQAQTTFQKVYLTGADRSAKSVLPTDDGGYMIAGSTTTNIVNDLDIYMLKTNDKGDTIVSKKYGGKKPDFINGMTKTSDGDFFIIGYTQSFSSGDFNIYLLKLDNNADTIWTRTYGGFGYDEGKEIIPTSDGNYVIVATSNSLNYSNYNVELIKINPAGDMIWTKQYGGNNYDSGHSVKECPDGSLIVAGKTASTAQSVSSILLLKTNANGDSTWAKTYSGPDSYEGKFILANNDGSFTLCSDDSSGARDSDIKVMKLDGAGGILWEKIYGGTMKDIGKMIQPTSDGGYIVAGITRSFGLVNPDMWLLKLDAAGDTTWARRYGSSGHEHCYAALETGDGGYIAIGHTKANFVNTEIMFLKLNSQGKLGPLAVEEFASAIRLSIYPNPTIDGTTKINWENTYGSDPESSLTVSDMQGRKIFSEKLTNSNIVQLDLKEEKPGIYLVTVQGASYSSSQRLVIQ